MCSGESVLIILCILIQAAYTDAIAKVETLAGPIQAVLVSSRPPVSAGSCSVKQRFNERECYPASYLTIPSEHRQHVIALVQARQEADELQDTLRKTALALEKAKCARLDMEDITGAAVAILNQATLPKPTTVVGSVVITCADSARRGGLKTNLHDPQMSTLCMVLYLGSKRLYRLLRGHLRCFPSESKLAGSAKVGANAVSGINPRLLFLVHTVLLMFRLIRRHGDAPNLAPHSRPGCLIIDAMDVTESSALSTASGVVTGLPTDSDLTMQLPNAGTGGLAPMLCNELVNFLVHDLGGSFALPIGSCLLRDGDKIRVHRLLLWTFQAVLGSALNGFQVWIVMLDAHKTNTALRTILCESVDVVKSLWKRVQELGIAHGFDPSHVDCNPGDQSGSPATAPPFKVDSDAVPHCFPHPIDPALVLILGTDPEHFLRNARTAISTTSPEVAGLARKSKAKAPKSKATTPKAASLPTPATSGPSPRTTGRPTTLATVLQASTGDELTVVGVSTRSKRRTESVLRRDASRGGSELAGSALSEEVAGPPLSLPVVVPVEVVSVPATTAGVESSDSSDSDSDSDSSEFQPSVSSCGAGGQTGAIPNTAVSGMPVGEDTLTSGGTDMTQTRRCLRVPVIVNGRKAYFFALWSHLECLLIIDNTISTWLDVSIKLNSASVYLTHFTIMQMKPFFNAINHCVAEVLPIVYEDVLALKAAGMVLDPKLQNMTNPAGTAHLIKLIADLSVCLLPFCVTRNYPFRTSKDARLTYCQDVAKELRALTLEGHARARGMMSHQAKQTGAGGAPPKRKPNQRAKLSGPAVLSRVEAKHGFPMETLKNLDICLAAYVTLLVMLVDVVTRAGVSESRVPGIDLPNSMRVESLHGGVRMRGHNHTVDANTGIRRIVTVAHEATARYAMEQERREHRREARIPVIPMDEVAAHPSFTPTVATGGNGSRTSMTDSGTSGTDGATPPVPSSVSASAAKARTPCEILDKALRGRSMITPTGGPRGNENKGRWNVLDTGAGVSPITTPALLASAGLDPRPNTGDTVTACPESDDLLAATSSVTSQESDAPLDHDEGDLGHDASAGPPVPQGELLKLLFEELLVLIESNTADRTVLAQEVVELVQFCQSDLEYGAGVLSVLKSWVTQAHLAFHVIFHNPDNGRIAQHKSDDWNKRAALFQMFNVDNMNNNRTSGFRRFCAPRSGAPFRLSPAENILCCHLMTVVERDICLGLLEVTEYKEADMLLLPTPKPAGRRGAAVRTATVDVSAGSSEVRTQPSIRVGAPADGAARAVLTGLFPQPQTPTVKVTPATPPVIPTVESAPPVKLKSQGLSERYVIGFLVCSVRKWFRHRHTDPQSVQFLHCLDSSFGSTLSGVGDVKLKSGEPLVRVRPVVLEYFDKVLHPFLDAGILTRQSLLDHGDRHYAHVMLAVRDSVHLQEAWFKMGQEAWALTSPDTSGPNPQSMRHVMQLTHQRYLRMVYLKFLKNHKLIADKGSKQGVRARLKSESDKVLTWKTKGGQSGVGVEPVGVVDDDADVGDGSGGMASADVEMGYVEKVVGHRTKKGTKKRKTFGASTNQDKEWELNVKWIGCVKPTWVPLLILLEDQFALTCQYITGLKDGADKEGMQELALEVGPTLSDSSLGLAVVERFDMHRPSVDPEGSQGWELRVCWEGHEEQTWEPLATMIDDTPQLVQEYLESIPPEEKKVLLCSLEADVP